MHLWSPIQSVCECNLVARISYTSNDTVCGVHSCPLTEAFVHEVYNAGYNPVLT